MKNFAFTVLVAFSFVFAGCNTITNESKTLIGAAAAVGQGDLSGWRDMSPRERYVAHWKLTRALHVLDFAVNDHKIPTHFEGDVGKNPPPSDSSWVSEVSP